MYLNKIFLESIRIQCYNMYNKVRAKSIMDKFLLKVSNKDTERKSLT